MPYIHELERWPSFSWSTETLAERLAAVRHKQGRLIGRMEGLGFNLRAEAALQSLTEEVIKSSEIEGEVLDRDQVRSSIARRLGVDIGALTPADRHVEGVVEMMLDATEKYAEPLTAERLFGWHAALFPTGRSGMLKIVVGGWRTEQSGPMQVVSGPIGRERVHYRSARRQPARSGDERIPGLVQRPRRHRPRAQGRHRASVVRDHSPVRGRQRPHRARDCRPGAGPLRGQRATLLQHVGADPAGA